MASLESYTPCLLGTMDKLWFQGIVLFPEPICSNKIPAVKASPNSSLESQPSSNSSSATTDCSDDDITDEFSPGVHDVLPSTISTTPQNKNDSEHEEKKPEEIMKELRPTRANLIIKKIKQSGTPIRRRIKTRIRLERTVICKSLVELQQEEVKGFMDLGFIFQKDRITPKMMSVIPGLQRLRGQDDEGNTEENRYGDNEGDERRTPYLSEAWLIKRPESPLLRLRMPRFSAASNHMKKHLKPWAKTVAYSAAQNE